VLGVSEETWQSALQGDHDDYDNNDVLSIGRDIVACREALFPETILDQSRQVQQQMALDDKSASMAQEEEETDNYAETKSIEELLRKLGGLRGPDAMDHAPSSTPLQDDWSFLGRAEHDAGPENVDGDLDTKVERLTNELQSWRRRNMETPYEEWSAADQERLSAWVKGYVQTVASSAERHRRIDYDATRMALLAQPPVTEAESDAFWSPLQHYATATALLDVMVHDGPPAGATLLQSAFWDLPRHQQLTCLLNLGAVRPLLDEYTKESDRLRFLQRHGDTILAGVPLEHLVPDPQGPVRAMDLKPDVVVALGIPESARFRLQLLPYKSGAIAGSSRRGDDDAMTTSRALFMAWNEHKAGRARYEEKLFQTGRLGLRYRDKIVDPDAKH
jgi:hypothetical protein